MSSTDSPEPTSEPVSETAADSHPSQAEQMRLAVRAAEDRKAEGLRVLDLSAVSDFTDRFLLCNGTNQRQVQAIADHILEVLRASGVRPLHVEGQQVGSWVLLDYGGDMVIHVFQDEIRAFYGLDRLWSDAPDITEKFVSAAASAASGGE